MCSRALTRRLPLLGMAAIAVLAAASFAGTAHAALRAYDPFRVGSDPGAGQYQPGTEDSGPNLGGQDPTIGPDTSFYAGPWVQGGGDTQVVKDIPSLSYPMFFRGRRGQQEETVQFSCCTFGRTGRPFGDVFGLGQNGLASSRDYNALYGSFLIDWGTVGTNPAWDPTLDPNPGSNEGKHGFEMWNDSPATDPDSKLVVDLSVNYYTGDPHLYLNVLGNRQNLAGDWTRPELAALNNGTHLVVMKLEFGLDPDNDDTTDNSEDRVTVWLDPLDSIEGNWTPAASIGVPTGSLVISHHGAFSSYQFDGGGANPGAIDEIRWGDTFADVTPFIPEPSSFLLFALGAVGILMRRQGR